MSTPTSAPDDARLRELLAHADPEHGRTPEVPEGLLARVTADLAEDGARPSTAAAGPAGGEAARGSFLRRHWQGGLLVAAGVTSLALAAATVLPGLLPAAGGDSSAAGQSVISSEAAAAGAGADTAAALVSGSTDAGTAGSSTTDAAAPAARDSRQTLVRSASVLVGTDDIQAGRTAFVSAIEGMGGMVMSETVVTRDGAGGGTPEPARDLSYPAPYPSGPGIWLTVQVPAAQYAAALQAARATGEVVQLQQSSYDVGAQITDVDARIAALEASLKTLRALMGDAESVSDVIKLESAISQRQSELDSLRAQQRELANQTAMSQISLTLQSPEDARGSLEPQPPQTWWESFLAGLGQFWSWLGGALLILSPLLLAGALIWWVRRRRARRSGPGASADPGPDAPSPA